MRRIPIIFLVGGAIAVCAFALLGFERLNEKPSVTPVPTDTPTSTPATPSPTEVATPTPTPTAQPSFADPIADFKNRITKKTFGTYITPSTSPVQPERFKGYHAGIDVEYTDVKTDVPVFALNSGTVKRAEFISGYGGVVVLQTTLNGKSRFVLYGHLRPSSLPKVGATLSKGQSFAVLGTGYSQETDGERRHLHLAVIKSSTITVKGYATTKAELNESWENPLIYFSK